MADQRPRAGRDPPPLVKVEEDDLAGSLVVCAAACGGASDDSGEDHAIEAGGASVPVPYIVMEFVEGETLAERLSRGRLSPVESLGIALQIALGLAHAHKQGIVHRDISPANVVVTYDGGVKIVDFGIVKARDKISRTRTGQIATSRFSRWASSRPLVEMWRPVL